MIDVALLQQALEALEKANKSCNCGHEWMSHTPTCRHLVCSTAIDALRTAIAQAEQPLSEEQRSAIVAGFKSRNWTAGDTIDAVEAAHNIKEQQP